MNRRWRGWELLCRTLFADLKRQTNEALGRDLATADDGVGRELVGFANRMLVTAPLWVALRRRELVGSLNPAIADYLHAFYELNLQRNLAIRRQLIECIAALNRAGITPMPLKGASYLLDRLYDDDGGRFSHDIDLMVPSEQSGAAFDALTAIGYLPMRSRFDHSRHHHLAPMVRTVDDVSVELHVAPVLPAFERALNTEDVWAAASERSIGDQRYAAPSATDSVMLSFLHGEAVDRDLARAIVNLRTFVDLRDLLRRYGDAVDWQQNATRAGNGPVRGSLFRYVDAYERLTGQSLSIEIPDRLLFRLHRVLCAAAIRSPAIAGLCLDIEELRETRLRERYSLDDDASLLVVYRIRRSGSLLRRRILRTIE